MTAMIDIGGGNGQAIAGLKNVVMHRRDRRGLYFRRRTDASRIALEITRAHHERAIKSVCALCYNLKAFLNGAIV